MQLLSKGRQGAQAPETAFDNHRIEHKFYISLAEAAALRARLAPILQTDPNSDEKGRYLITSIYFDTPAQRSLHSSEAGVGLRKKIRIRAYNHSATYIRIEYKERHGRLSRKRGFRVTEEDCHRILGGDPTPLLSYAEDADQSKREVALQLYHDIAVEGYRPASFVEYEREIYTHPISRVRITLDTQIRGGANRGELFPSSPLPSIFPQDMVLLEVKYSHFLPAFIAALLPVDCTPAVANSKFLRSHAFS